VVTQYASKTEQDQLAGCIEAHLSSKQGGGPLDLLVSIAY